MTIIDIPEVILQEEDVVGNAYCFQCFEKPGVRNHYFYNGYGPFCNKRCFAKYLGIAFGDLPTLIKGKRVK